MDLGEKIWRIYIIHTKEKKRVQNKIGLTCE